jgi:integrase
MCVTVCVIMRLKPEQVAAAIRSGVDQKIPDGNNLYLLVRNGRGYWVYQYREGATIRSKGLGSAATVTPAQARRARENFVVRRRNGSNAPVAFSASVVTAPLGAATAVRDTTFGDVVTSFIADKAASWKGGLDGGEANAYRRTLVGGALACLPIAAVDTAAVLAAIKPMPAVTAEKTRTRIAKILDWAKALGYRQGENPARRRGHMEHLLGELPKARHHAALPWSEVPALMRDLQAEGSIAAKALAFTILTAARTSETLGAIRSEIKSPEQYADIAKLPVHVIPGDTWIVPAERMKETREHHVPLTTEALALTENRKGRLFPGYSGQMMALLNKLRPGFTVHGFRSTFVDWAADHDYPQELREMALAHAVGDSVEQAYRHSTRLNRRREMMQAWTDYVFGKGASD